MLGKWFQCFQVWIQFCFPAWNSNSQVMIVTFTTWKQGYTTSLQAPLTPKLWVKPHSTALCFFRRCNNFEKCWAEVYFPALYKERITNPLTKLIVQTRLGEQMALNFLQYFGGTHIPKGYLNLKDTIFSKYCCSKISFQQKRKKERKFKMVYFSDSLPICFLSR